ncbi:MAG: PLP-dependent aminotransferase family protein [Turicibacter sp.]|nr:PLP-dependent aminotransferase family protein [Turicibacter sp.]
MKLYQKIHSDLRQNILSGSIKQGQRLPSITELSHTYQCSKGTVIKALDLLRTQHIIFSKPQSGYYVVDNLMHEKNVQNGYKLDTGNPLVNELPTLDLKHCLNLATDAYANHSLDINLKGIDSLIQTLVPYLSDDGIYTKDSHIYPIQGVAQVLAFLTLFPFPNGKKTILIEEPTYSYYIDFLKSHNVEPCVIKRNKDGIDLKLLESYFKHGDVKFFYTVPRNHNPLGTAYTYKQRKRIMELALKYDVYIVEDDYFGHVHKLPKYVPLHFFSYQKKCIYLRSFTKELPFLRIGIAVIPDCFYETFEQISMKSYYYSYHIPSLISQATLEAYIRSSIYQKHTLNMHQSITKKLYVLRTTSVAWDPAVMTLIGAKSGYYATLKCHSSVDTDLLITRLRQKHVFVKSNRDMFYYPDNYDSSIRLSISQVSLEQLRDALGIIYELVLSMVG